MTASLVRRDGGVIYGSGIGKLTLCDFEEIAGRADLRPCGAYFFC